jgi:hypothetical protein
MGDTFTFSSKLPSYSPQMHCSPTKIPIFLTKMSKYTKIQAQKPDFVSVSNKMKVA